MDMSLAESRWRDAPSSAAAFHESSISAPVPIDSFRDRNIAQLHNQHQRLGDPIVHAAASKRYSPPSYLKTESPSQGTVSDHATASRRTSDGPSNAGHLAGSLPPIVNSDDCRPRASPVNHMGRRQSMSRPAADLTLHIPTAVDADLPRLGSAYTPVGHVDRFEVGAPGQSTQSASMLLPSLAQFDQTASRAPGLANVAGKGTSSQTSPCMQCIDARPLLQDLVVASANLERTIQAHFEAPLSQASDCPSGNTAETLKWILLRLSTARTSMQDAAIRRETAYTSQSHHAPQLPFSPKDNSPPGSLKRLSDFSEGDLLASKRQRNNSDGGMLSRPGSFSAINDEQRRIIEASAQGFPPRRGLSPAPSDSQPGSAHPRAQSPSFQGRSLRPLPSPSSMVGASNRPAAFRYADGTCPPPGSSPTASHYAPSTIYTASSTSTATSQHIAELRHQISIKTIAHESLQGEYHNLLQKVQREKVKSQAIEKKTSVADQEINDLTSKGEELTEQVKALETQLDELEKKREKERSEFATEKDQWGRMLEMSGKLQARGAEERRNLAEEIEGLKARLEREGTDEGSTVKTGTGPDDAARGALAGLRKDNAALAARVQSLKTVLQDVGGKYAAMEEQGRAYLDQQRETAEFLARAIEDNDGGLVHGDRATGTHMSLQHASLTFAAGRRLQPTPSVASRIKDASPPNIWNTARSTAYSLSATGKVKESPSAPTPLSPPKSIDTASLPQWRPPQSSPPSQSSGSIPTPQRRASGPSTPYPGTESQQWQQFTSRPITHPTSSSKASTKSQTSPSRAIQGPLRAPGEDKVPALNYTPWHVDPATARQAREKSKGASSPGASSGEKKEAASTEMPPPPRPAVSGS